MPKKDKDKVILKPPALGKTGVLYYVKLEKSERIVGHLDENGDALVVGQNYFIVALYYGTKQRNSPSNDIGLNAITHAIISEVEFVGEIEKSESRNFYFLRERSKSSKDLYPSYTDEVLLKLNLEDRDFSNCMLDSYDISNHTKPFFYTNIDAAKNSVLQSQENIKSHFLEDIDSYNVKINELKTRIEEKKKAIEIVETTNILIENVQTLDEKHKLEKKWKV